ncbi:hypothetical protein MHYP_G00140330 [Metynnis hypsauchen]
MSHELISETSHGHLGFRHSHHLDNLKRVCLRENMCLSLLDNEPESEGDYERHRCSLGHEPNGRVTRDPSMLGTQISHSFFPPLYLSLSLLFSPSHHDGAKGEGRKPNKGMHAPAVSKRRPLACLSELWGHRVTMAFHIPEKGKVANERAEHDIATAKWP